MMREPRRRTEKAAPRGLLGGLDALLSITCAALLASLTWTALHDICRDWDAWYYHLPFAARVAGLAGPDALVFSPRSQANFDGFPLLGELCEGFLWRLSGRVQAANLPALACVPLLALWLKRRFGVRFCVTCLALLAVPLVLIHATSCYVDLLGNSATTALLLLVFDAYAKPDPPSRATLLAAAGAAAAAANVKLLLEPVVLLALATLALRAWPSLRALWAASRRRALAALALALVALLIVFATPLKNSVRHANPFYPEQVQLLGLALHGYAQPYHASPRWLADAPQPARFAASVLELGLAPLGSHRRWSVDQWTPPDAPGYRMGGFFGAYAVFQLLVLTWFALARGSRAARAAALGFLLTTALTCAMPQSHELRYYLFWMMTLVCTNLWLARERSASAQRALGFAGVLALGVVLWSTRGVYVYPGGSGLAQLLREQVDPATLGRIRPGAQVCARRQPYAFAWAALFHPPQRYQLKLSEDLAGCGEFRPLD
jgi:hypothetical protein